MKPISSSISLKFVYEKEVTTRFRDYRQWTAACKALFLQFLQYTKIALCSFPVKNKKTHLLRTKWGWKFMKTKNNRPNPKYCSWFLQKKVLAKYIVDHCGWQPLVCEEFVPGPYRLLFPMKYLENVWNVKCKCVSTFYKKKDLNTRVLTSCNKIFSFYKNQYNIFLK